MAHNRPCERQKPKWQSGDCSAKPLPIEDVIIECARPGKLAWPPHIQIIRE
jgi:hypothetical protein